MRIGICGNLIQQHSGYNINVDHPQPHFLSLCQYFMHSLLLKLEVHFAYLKEVTFEAMVTDFNRIVPWSKLHEIISS